MFETAILVIQIGCVGCKGSVFSVQEYPSVQSCRDARQVILENYYFPDSLLNSGLIPDNVKCYPVPAGKPATWNN